MRILYALVAVVLTFGFSSAATAAPLASGTQAVRAQNGITLVRWGHGRHARRHWYKYRSGAKYEDYHQHWR